MPEPETSFEFHGYRIGGKAIHIGELPGRKQVCLYVQDGSMIRPLAFFPTRDGAHEALQMLDQLAAALVLVEAP